MNGSRFSKMRNGTRNAYQPVRIGQGNNLLNFNVVKAQPVAYDLQQSILWQSDQNGLTRP